MNLGSSLHAEGFWCFWFCQVPASGCWLFIAAGYCYATFVCHSTNNLMINQVAVALLRRAFTKQTYCLAMKMSSDILIKWMNYFNKTLSNRCVWNWVIVFAYKHRPLAGPADEDKWSRQEQYSSRFINKLIYPRVEWLLHFLISLGC